MSRPDLMRSIVLDTLVFEDLRRPPEERAFEHDDLAAWGFDLLRTRSESRDGYAVGRKGEHKAGDSLDGGRRVEEVLGELPAGSRLVGRIEMRDGRAVLVLSLDAGGGETAVADVPAGDLLLGFLRANGLPHAEKALRDVGHFSSLVVHEAQDGRPKGLEELPPPARRFVREARDLQSDAGSGRLSVSWYGPAKDGRERYRIRWNLPTLYLFDTDRARAVDVLLSELP